MIAYKLVRKLKSGEITPLMINKTQRLPVGEWMDAQDHTTKGFASRPGWHCVEKPHAPHLTSSGRQWYTVELENYERVQMPHAHGGEWLIAERIKILEEYHGPSITRENV